MFSSLHCFIEKVTVGDAWHPFTFCNLLSDSSCAFLSLGTRNHNPLLPCHRLNLQDTTINQKYSVQSPCFWHKSVVSESLEMKQINQCYKSFTNSCLHVSSRTTLWKWRCTSWCWLAGSSPCIIQGSSFLGEATSKCRQICRDSESLCRDSESQSNHTRGIAWKECTEFPENTQESAAQVLLKAP